MVTRGQRTYSAAVGAIEPRWYLVDARGQTLGRLAVNIARVLRGKHRPEYTPHVLCGDQVVVINARDVVVTGHKRSQKIYDRYSGYPGGRRERTFDQQMERDAAVPLRLAVRGMLQHNTLGAAELGRLRVYPGAEHPHAAQGPTPITFGDHGEVLAS
ncbi:MAG TPA: 50S ribosomal protein L13 [Candidatus Dormibacteraeota bacterium]|nr:50S ribosomal protein L13 [Candidatus Dormibacteraeota bacterium]